MSRTLHLNLFILGAGHHESAWIAHKNPATIHTLDHFTSLARAAEAAKFDSVFIADTLSLTKNVAFHPHEKLDPISVLGAIAASTTDIGIIGTASTGFAEPYNTARQFASLDHLSGGRIGWNIVTTAEAEAWGNFGRAPRSTHDTRYRRADEFVGLAIQLWDSWADDALVRDKGTKEYVDTSRVFVTDHDGEFFTSAGPLNIPRPPQGRPVLVQAGASVEGLAFAAKYAEATFTAQYFLDDATAFADDLRSRVRAAGRDPRQLHVLPGLIPLIGSTEAEATAYAEELDALGGTQHSFTLLEWLLGGISFEGLDLDAPLPEELLPDEADVSGQRARFSLLVRLARRERLSLRQLAQQISRGHGHRVVVGTPEQVADDIETWFRAGAADGFNIMPPVFPDGLEVFSEHVVPILQRRGLFRTEYEGRTLRDHYGLHRPAHDVAGRRAFA